ncbi:unnamed protein product [Effrenium voratum]|nr:unnamed protein product [Effrenium voratum]
MAGYLGDPQRYICEVDASGNPDVVPSGNTINCQVNSTTAPIRRLAAAGTTCDLNSVEAVGLDDVQFVHNCDPAAHEDVCVAHCDFGYEMTSSVSVLICDLGNLVGDAPGCQPLPCNFSLPGPKTSHNCSGAVTGEFCRVGCADGYTGTDTMLRCSQTGNFVGAQPTCDPLVCNDLQLSGEFSSNCQGKQYTESCTVVCAEGYELLGGSGRQTCGVNGFNGTLPSCRALPCANTVPFDPTFYRDACENVASGESCNVSCRPGFQETMTQLVCGSSGSLQGTLPRCQALSCPGGQLANASLAHTCTGVSVGENCSAFCARGFEASSGLGLEQLSCRMDGEDPKLLGPMPACRPVVCSLGLPQPSSRALDNCSSLYAGETCVQECNQGYEGNLVSYHCGADSIATSSSTPECRLERCDWSVIPSFLMHTCENVTYGSSCFAYCPPGYISDDNPATRLDCAGPAVLLPALSTAEDITLRGFLPFCEPATCRYNIPWETQYVHNCTYTEVTGRHCLVSCGDGWNGGYEALVCQANGELAGQYPTCTRTTTTVTSTRTQTTTAPYLHVEEATGHLIFLRVHQHFFRIP